MVLSAFVIGRVHSLAVHQSGADRSDDAGFGELGGSRPDA